MITYESLKELAHLMSKENGCRYVGFGYTDKGYVVISVCNEPMVFVKCEMRNSFRSYWRGEKSKITTMDLGKLNDINWSKCQFDCKETYRGIDFYNGKPFEYHGTHNGVDYWIVSYGYHPLAYVKLNQIESKLFSTEYECHGEITFKGPKKFEESIEFVVGWDYAHFILNDYTLYLDKTEKDEENLKRWTFDEVEKEIFEFIDKYKMQEENGATDISN